MRGLQGSKPTAFHLRSSVPTASQQEIRHGGSSHTMQSPWKSPSVCHFPKPIFDEEVGKKGGEKEEIWRKHPLAHSRPCTLSQAACVPMHNRVVLSEAPNAKS